MFISDHIYSMMMVSLTIKAISLLVTQIIIVIIAYLDGNKNNSWMNESEQKSYYY